MASSLKNETSNQAKGRCHLENSNRMLLELWQSHDPLHHAFRHPHNTLEIANLISATLPLPTDLRHLTLARSRHVVLPAQHYSLNFGSFGVSSLAVLLSFSWLL